MNLVKAILHLEGFAALAAAVALYFGYLDGHWIPFAIFLLAPDITMVGYLRDTRLGAALYNAAHNYVVPIALAGAGFALDMPVLTGAGLILAAHVGMDRALGYGLKFPTRFKDTHLQRVATPTTPAAQ